MSASTDKVGERVDVATNVKAANADILTLVNQCLFMNKGLQINFERLLTIKYNAALIIRLESRGCATDSLHVLM
ncbi:hypothetical protein B8W98_01765 [Lentilactobacillus parakefiri]|uniref:Uncharacterized protein n=1 Tax=Lentilactobacillus parakefiri TaxID=152332 RepID=A0A269YP06_9LACO|nr:hypothetical protein B8W98_01765 [Lentilactobacillus parakefiri]